MVTKERLLSKKEKTIELLSKGKVLEEYQAYLPEAAEDIELAFHYFMRDTIIEYKRNRKQKGITQAELAARMGTKQAAVSRFETYNGEPSLKFLFKYANALGEKTPCLSFKSLSDQIHKQTIIEDINVSADDNVIVKVGTKKMSDASQVEYEYHELTSHRYTDTVVKEPTFKMNDVVLGVSS